MPPPERGTCPSHSTATRYSSRPTVERGSVEASEAHDPVGGLDEPSHIGRSDPPPADRRQVGLGRLTGDGTSLSNVDRDVVLSRLGEQVADGWHADALQRVPHAGLEQFRRVTGENDADLMTDLERPVDREVEWDRGPGRIGSARRGQVQRPHGASVRPPLDPAARRRAANQSSFGAVTPTTKAQVTDLGLRMVAGAG